MANQGTVMQALVNAVLALYGEPEPHGTEPLDSIADRLHRLAAELRTNGAET